MLGGALLVASALIRFGLGAYGAGMGPVLGYLPLVLFSAAVVVFAIGIGSAGSVTARRRLGTGMLIALAVWLLAKDLFVNALASGMTESSSFALGALVISSDAVSLIIALIATTQIAVARVVPGRWAWVPFWALLVVALCVAIRTSPAATAVAGGHQNALWALHGVLGFVHTAAICALGVAAMVLAMRPVPERTVQVYPAPPMP